MHTMSKLIIKKGMTTEHRLKAIKKAADRFHKKIGKSRKVRRTETSVMDRKYDGENINAWTDAPQYAEKYYGERYRDTVSHDNDWN